MAKEEYRLAAIMFTDIVGFSRMMEADERGTLELLKMHNKLIGDLVKKYNGNIIKTIGDAFLIDFKNVADSVQCGIDIQNELAKYNRSHKTKKLNLRIGVHLGDIWFFENDALGEGINIASRLQSLAKPGRICISKDVYNQVFNKIDCEMISIGKAKLKNISKEIYAFEVLTAAAQDYVEEDIQNLKTENIVTPQTETKENVQEKTQTASQSQQTQTEAQDKSKKEEEALKSSILNRIKIANYKIPFDQLQEYFPNSDQVLVNTLDKLTQSGVLKKIEHENGELEYGFGDFQKFWPQSNPKRKKKSPNDMINRKIKQLTKNVTGFRSHFITYSIIMICLFAINILTSPLYPWFLFPLGGWGIGIVAHLFTVFSSNKQLRQLNRIPPTITENQYRLIRKIQKNEEGFIAHLGSYIGVNAFLIMVNVITFGGSFWFVLPMLGWGIGLVAHSLSAINNHRKLSEKLSNTSFDLTVLKDKGGLDDYQRDKANEKAEKVIGKEPEGREYQEYLKQVEFMKDSIIKKIKQSPPLKERLDEDLEEILNKYYQKLTDLIQRESDINKMIHSISVDQINEEMALMNKKHEESTSKVLKNEYKKSIEQYQKHLHSYQELKNQKEIVNLRISSAMMSLKQLQLDLSNIEEIVTSEENDTIRTLEEKSLDLSRYVQNLKNSYENLDLDTEI
ncbi:MAG: 2TM domain-containing protein [Spirochaetes bacterium]|nr:2TM domain-containing protein [Spirochaetota bacterium]